MSITAKPYTFSPNTTISSSQVNDNFDTLFNDYNGGISAANLATDAVTTAKIADSNVTTAKIADLNVTTGKLADNVMTNAKVSAGMVVQVVDTSTTAVATGTTVIPIDDTTPQNTEGDEYMTLAITPKSATNKLVIDVVAVLSSSAAANNIQVALFQDSTASAIAGTSFNQATATGIVTISFKHTMVAGTTSATTFKVRAGGSSAGTTTFNGRSGARIFGGITKSSIVITEYKSS